MKLLILLILNISSWAIVDGQKVENRDKLANFMVSWAYKKNLFCSGVIISRRKVLTAAHCVSGGLDEIVFDTHVSQSSFSIPVIKAEIHPDYAPEKMKMPYPNTAVNDLVILTLRKDIPRRYHPIKLYDSITSKGKALLLGYGKNSAQGKMGTLRYREVKVTDYLVESGEWITTEAACGGDSGGALIYQTKSEVLLLGITSRSDKRVQLGECKGPSVQTDIIHQSQWIKESL